MCFFLIKNVHEIFVYWRDFQMCIACGLNSQAVGRVMNTGNQTMLCAISRIKGYFFVAPVYVWIMGL